MGLLNKAEEQGKELKPSLVSNMDKIKSPGSFLKAAYNLHENKDREKTEDSNLYSICSLFDIAGKKASKAALLLKITRSSDMLYPLLLKGFDETSSNRLRLSADSGVIRNKNSVFRAVKKDLSDFSNKLSTREFDMLENIIFLPVRHGNHFYGFFSLFDCDNDLNIKSLETDFSKLIESDSNRLFSRYDILPEKNYIVNKHEKYRKDFQSRADYSDRHNTVFQLLNISFEKYLNYLTGNYRDISRNFIRYDIINVLSSLFSGNGSVYSSSTDNIIIMFQNNSVQSVNIIIHQIKIALKRIFPGFKENYLECSSYIYPEQSSEILNIIT